jgi:O-antigen/teichoic acid export membrane protein
MIDPVPKAVPAGLSLGMTIARNTAFVTLGGILLKVVGFLFGVYVVRQLGDERFGQYSIVLAFVGLFQIFAELGISQFVMREIARDRTKAASLFWNLVAVRLVLAAVGIIGITIGAAGIGYSRALVLGVFLYTWTFVLSSIEAPLETVLTAHERFDIVMVLTVLGQVAFVLLGVLVLFQGWGFLALVGSGLIAMLPQVGLAWWVVRKNNYIDFTPRISPRAWPGLVRSGLPFMFISLSLTISFRFDTVILSKLQPEHVVGWYNVAYGLSRSLTYALAGFSVAMVPSLSRTFIHDAARVEIWYSRSIKFIALMALPIAVGGMLVAEPLVRALYTDEFLPAARALRIIIWDVPLLLFASFCGNMTTIVGEERSAARIYGASAAANILLNLLFIPRFGYLGASAVTVVTDLVAVVPFYVLLSRKLRLPKMYGALVRILLACLLMGLAVNGLARLNLWLAILGGAGVYAGLVLVFRILDREEIGSIQRVLAMRRGAWVEVQSVDPGSTN